MTFLFILSVLKRIQIYPKLQTWLTLSTVAGEHVQVIRDTQKNCRNRELQSRTGRSLLAGRCQAEAARKGLRPLLVKSRFMRTERTQNSHWSEVPHELISCKYLTRTTFRILKLAFNQWSIKP